MKKYEKPKITVILGPTGVGKSALAVSLARKLNGEIVSADSRQIYKGLDIGTEKITKKEMGGVPHHMLNVASPRRAWSVEQYKRKAEKVIDGIIKRGKIPFLVGGSGFYIECIVDNSVLPPVQPDTKLRQKLEKREVTELFKMLLKLDSKRAKVIDRQNKRRLIRSIEVAKELGSVPIHRPPAPRYDTLQIGLYQKQSVLEKGLNERLLKTIKRGLVNETKKLKESNISWKRINELGLEYKIAGEYIRGEITRPEMIEKVQRELKKYAKRQMRWFKRDERIVWFKLSEKKDIEKSIENFLGLLQ